MSEEEDIQSKISFIYCPDHGIKAKLDIALDSDEILEQTCPLDGRVLARINIPLNEGRISRYKAQAKRIEDFEKKRAKKEYKLMYGTDRISFRLRIGKHSKVYHGNVPHYFNELLKGELILDGVLDLKEWSIVFHKNKVNIKPLLAAYFSKELKEDLPKMKANIYLRPFLKNDKERYFLIDKDGNLVTGRRQYFYHEEGIAILKFIYDVIKVTNLYLRQKILNGLI